MPEQIQKNGSVIQVVTNTPTSGQGRSSYSNPNIAMDDMGNFVVLWEDYGPTESIMGQRFNSAGTAQGDKLPLGTIVDNVQGVDVAMDSDGDFTLMRFDEISSSFQGSAQRYDKLGAAQGTKIDISTIPTCSYGSAPSIAMDADGDFVVSYKTGSYSSEVKRYNSAGVQQGDPIALKGSDIYRSDVAIESDGDFVVAWSGQEPGKGTDIYVQRYNKEGGTVGDTLLMDFENASSDRPQIATDDAGNFVTTWIMNGLLVARRFDSKMNALGDIFLPAAVNSNEYDIAMDNDGDFALAWTQFGSSGPKLMVRGFNAAGEARGAAMEIDASKFGNGICSNLSNFAIAMDADNDFVVTWNRQDVDTSSSQPTVTRSVFAQRFQIPGMPMPMPMPMPTPMPPKSEAPPMMMQPTPGDDRISGTNSNDLINGLAGKDELAGLSGNDTLSGGLDDDILNGGEGDDTLMGDQGRDTMTGGAGKDIFALQKNIVRGRSGKKSVEVDVISDFNPAEDVIRIPRAFSQRLKAGKLGKGRFRGGKNALDRDDMVIYNKKTGGLFVDTNANGKGGQFQVAQLSPNLSLSANNFMIG